jgi:hypothetical protein
MSEPTPTVGGMSLPHPWAEFRRWPGTRIFWRDLGHGVRGKTDGKDVWVHNRLLQVERRCVAAHEQEHLRRGHTSCVPGPEEDRVKFAAAKWLLPDPHKVADAIVWSGNDIELAADHLWVDVPTMRARIDSRYMHPAERKIIQTKINEEHHP